MERSVTGASGECTVELRVRYSETDQMGVVYHANYLAWCEIGRTELMRLRGRSYAAVEADGVLLAVAEASLRYLRSARYDDLIRVRTVVTAVRSRLVEFGYTVFRVEPDGSETRLATARTALVAIDRDGRTRSMPRSLVELLRAFPSDPMEP
jgi:acyl-CoA thioester hydrolase